MLIADYCYEKGKICQMKPILQEEICNVYEEDKVMETKKVIGKYRKYHAFYECAICGRRENVGEIKCDINMEDNVTFEDVVAYIEKMKQYNEALEDFKRRQQEELAEFERNNEPQFKR